MTKELNIKKAAMFGLDARIALAIFGALSVISSAALYSAIQKAELTRIVTGWKEIGKAWEQYYLDTGRDLGVSSSNKYAYLTANLIDKPAGVKGWQGPYLNYETGKVLTSSLDQIIHPEYGMYYLRKISDASPFTIDNYCPVNNRCSIWINLNLIPDDKLALKLDKYIDDGDGKDAGDFRWEYRNTTWKWNYALKYASIPNPN